MDQKFTPLAPGTPTLAQPAYPPAAGVGYAQPPMAVQMQPMIQPAIQPGAMMVPADINGFFGPLDSFFVKQLVEMLEVMTGIETNNRYEIYTKTNPHGPMLFAKEQSDFCARQCLGPSRPFVLPIVFSGTQHPLVVLNRAFKCCANECFVTDGTGRPIGSIKQKIFACCERLFHIFDANDQPLYEVQSPCCSPWTFHLRTARGADGAPGRDVGVIKKQWGGIMKEWLTDADNFAVEFDPSIPPEHKALFLAMVFIIDFAYFEQSNRRNNTMYM